MIKQLLILLLVLAIPASAIDKELIAANLDVIKNSYNENFDKVPDIVKALFGSEKLNVYIDDSTFGIEMEKGFMKNVEEGGLENPSMNVYLSEETVLRLVNEEVNIEEALGDGEVKYEAVGFKNKVKYGLVGVGLKVVSWFS